MGRGKIQRYDGDIALLTLNVGGSELVGGYVLGKMPDDPETESWRAIFKVYGSFMPPKVRTMFGR